MSLLLHPDSTTTTQFKRKGKKVLSVLKKATGKRNSDQNKGLEKKVEKFKIKFGRNEKVITFATPKRRRE